MGLFDKLFSKMTNEEFWEWFCLHLNDFSKIATGNEPICLELGKKLNKVKKGLTYAFGHLENQEEFVISADGISENFPAVIELANSAPQIPGWKITAFRPPTPGLSICLGNVSIDPEDIWFSAEAQNDRVDVKLYIKDAHRMGKEAAAFGFLILDTNLGEYAVETKLRGMELANLPDNPETLELLPIKKLAETVEELTK